MRCRYCYDSAHPGGDMDFDTAAAAIQVAIKAVQAKGDDQSLGVIFFGGEPLLCRDLIQRIVRFCGEIEASTGQTFHFKVTTNGLLLDEAFLTHPDTAGIFVALSHDGVQAAHDAHRVDAAGRSTFERLRPQIDLLIRHRPYAPVMLVVTPETVSSYAQSVAWLFDRGFRYLICSLNYAGAWQEPDMEELRRQYEAIAEWYSQKIIAEAKFYFSPFEVKISSRIFPGRCQREQCELGMRQISVAPDGQLYPCVQFAANGGDPAYAIGHVRSGIDEAARQKLYHANAREKETCAQCAIRLRCNHHCGCLNRQSTGRIDRASPVLCAHERIVLPIADRLAARLFKRRSPMFVQKHYNELFPLVSLVEDSVRPRP